MLKYKITATCAGIHGDLVNCKDVGLIIDTVLKGRAVAKSIGYINYASTS